MKEQQDELLYSSRDGANSLHTEGSTHSRGYSFKKDFSGRCSFEGVLFQGGHSFEEIWCCILNILNINLFCKANYTIENFVLTFDTVV